MLKTKLKMTMKLLKQITLLSGNIDYITKITLKIFLASLIVLLSCAAISHLATALYGVMYFIVFPSIFTTFITFIVLLILLAKRQFCKR